MFVYNYGFNYYDHNKDTINYYYTFYKGENAICDIYFDVYYGAEEDFDYMKGWNAATESVYDTKYSFTEMKTNGFEIIDYFEVDSGIGGLLVELSPEDKAIALKEITAIYEDKVARQKEANLIRAITLTKEEKYKILASKDLAANGKKISKCDCGCGVAKDGAEVSSCGCSHSKYKDGGGVGEGMTDIKGGENEDYSHKVGDRITDGTGRSGDIVEVKDNGTRVVKINYANGSVNPFVINVDENDIEYWTVLYAKGSTIKGGENRSGDGEELMGGQPNSSSPSGYYLISEKGNEIIVSDDGGKTKERYVKSNNYSGYTLRYKGNQYEFMNSFANGGGVNKGKELWFSPSGEIKTENKGTAKHYIEQHLAKRFGAESMELVGEDEKDYIYELNGNPMMIAAKTAILEEENGLDIESYGRKKRVHIPKSGIDQTSVHLRYPLITPFKNGGGVGRKRHLYAIMMGKYSQMDNPQYVEVSGRDMDEAMSKFKQMGVDAVPEHIHFSNKPPYYYKDGGGIGIDSQIEELEAQKIILNNKLMDISMGVVDRREKPKVENQMLILSSQINELLKKKYGRKMTNGGGLDSNDFEMDNSTYTIRMWDTDMDKLNGVAPLVMTYKIKSQALDLANRFYYENDYGVIEVEDENGNRVLTLDAYAANGKSISMNVDKCERCHQPTNNKTTMSMFNEDVICMSCKEKERQNPNYSKAETADIEQIKKGNYNYSGIGYLPDNYSEHAIMMDGEIYTGDSYYNIVSDQGPNFFNKDESERGYVDNKGEFYDEEIGSESLAADGKPIQEADYLTNAMLSILDLKNYLDSHNDQIIINGSKYNYFSHAQYNLRVTGGQGAIYNIIPYFPETTVGQLQNGKFYTLLRKLKAHNFAISVDGLVLDIAEDGMAIA
jgi:hypothetical protein